MLQIVKGPHVLFVGVFGRKTAGITVRSTQSDGQRQWDINTFWFRSTENAENLGISVEEHAALVAECEALETGA